MSTLKRALLGPPIPTRQLAHTLLPKVLALPVFSSDALSSVAYATEEILTVLVGAGAGSARLVFPIAVAVSLLMAIVVASYRQTVRGYPHGGGAYIVASRNLGTLPGLVAAAALLTDYVLTVTVSVAAGVFAVTSAIPAAGSLRVELSVGLVALMAVANLRGLRESGAVFAVPTYAFIASILVMTVVGLLRCVGGCPTAAVASPIEPGTGVVGLFVVLHAFSSGSTALTGVEAISNGVPAFRPPSARNAETVLATMAAIAIVMFLSISWLAVHTGARPSNEMSVLAQTARAALGSGIGFYAVQVTTAAILVVAANTAFQDFPRLSSILARDRFMPRPFLNRGDRLVFSNGIIALSLVSSLLVVAFDADVSRLIQLYVVGVFVAFTLSQSGMIVHWRRARDPGWRRRALINAVGALATGLVLVVITATKFLEGAWMVVVAIPIFVAAFLGYHRRSRSTQTRLTRGTVEIGEGRPNRYMLLVSDMGPPAVSAWRYLQALRPERLEALYVGSDEPTLVTRRWTSEIDPAAGLDEGGSRAHLAARVRAFEEPDGYLTVAVPGLHSERRRSLGMGPIARLARALIRDVSVVLAQSPAVDDPGETGADRVVAMVLADDATRPEAHALNYARSVGADEIRALHIALDPEGEQDDLKQTWARRGFEPPLEIVDAPLRHLGPPLADEVHRLTTRRDTLVLLIVPVVVGRGRVGWAWHRHARYVEGLFVREPGVMVCEVPFQLQPQS